VIGMTVMTRVTRASSFLAVGTSLALAVVSCGGSNFTSRDNAAGGSASGAGGSNAAGGAHGGATSGGVTGGGGVVSSGGTTSAGGNAGGGGATTTQDPISKVGLVYWFSADVGVTEASGAVSKWTDRSGNHQDAAQISAVSRPTRGKLPGTGQPAIVFDGADDYLGLPPLSADFAGGLSFFAVAEVAAGSACMALLEVSNGSEIDDVSFDWLSSALQYEVFNSDTMGQDGAFPIGEARLLEVTHSVAEDANLWVNGLSSGLSNFPLPTTTTRNQDFIGKTLYQGCPTLSGAISEIILYSRPLGSSERAGVETYLQSKWGCCSN
jgi:hypothetical protein